MTTSPTLKALYDERDNLDLPMLDICAILETTADHFGIDLPQFMTLMVNFDTEGLATLTREQGEGVNLLRDLLDEAVESSTQIPHISRAFALDRLILELED